MKNDDLMGENVEKSSALIKHEGLVTDIRRKLNLNLMKQDDGINFMYPENDKYIKINKGPWELKPRYRPKIWKYFNELKNKISSSADYISTEPTVEMVNGVTARHNAPGFCSCVFGYRLLDKAIEYNWGIYYMAMPDSPLDFKLSTGTVCNDKEYYGVIFDSWGDLVKIKMCRDKGWTRLTVFNDLANESKENFITRSQNSPYLVRSKDGESQEYSDGLIHGKTLVSNEDIVNGVSMLENNQFQPFISDVDMFEVMCR